MNFNMISIGERIRNRRKELHLSQTDIYEKCELTSGALSKIENGKTIPSIFVFYKLSQALDCDINWLLTGNSSYLQSSDFCKKEEIYLNLFQQLPDDEQDEIIEIINLKLAKNKRKSAISQKASLPLSENNPD